MGSLITPALVYCISVIGIICAIIFYFNNEGESPDITSQSMFSRMFSPGHDGTTHGRMRYWLDNTLKEKTSYLTELGNELPDEMRNIWGSIIQMSVYVVRGIALSSTWFAVTLGSNADLVHEIENDSMREVLKSALMDCCGIAFIIIAGFIILVSSTKASKSAPTTIKNSEGEEKQSVAEGNEDGSAAQDGNEERNGKKLHGQVAGQGDLRGIKPSYGRINRNNLTPTHEQAKCLELLKNDEPDVSSDLRMEEAMLAYITDCEAYDEEDLRRQNDELRQQIAMGPDKYFEMQENTEEQMEKLTKGMTRMLNQVKKESKFAGYALDTLKTEKRVVNTELLKLLAMSPQDLTQMEPADMFRELRSKVQRKVNN